MFLFNTCFEIGLEFSKYLVINGSSEFCNRVLYKDKNTPIINTISSTLAKSTDAGWEKLKNKKIVQEKLPKNFVKSIDYLKPCLTVDKLLNNARGVIIYPFKKSLVSQITDIENDLKIKFGEEFSQTSIRLTKFLVDEVLKLNLPILQNHLKSIIKVNLLSIFSHLATAYSKIFNDPENLKSDILGTIIDALIILLDPFQERLKKIDQLKPDERLQKYSELSIEIYDYLLKICFPKGEDSFIYPFESGKDAAWLILSTGNLPIEGKQPNEMINLKCLFAEKFCEYLDYSRSYRLAKKEKRILQESLRELPVGQLLVQGCQALTQDILNEIKNALKGFDSLISELNREVFDGKLNSDQMERLSKRIKKSKNLTPEKLFDICHLSQPVVDDGADSRKELLKDFALRFEKTLVSPSAIFEKMFKKKECDRLINDLNKKIFSDEIIKFIKKNRHLEFKIKVDALYKLVFPSFSECSENEENERISLIEGYVKRFEELQISPSNINEPLIENEDFYKIIDELTYEFFKKGQLKIQDSIQRHKHLAEKLFDISCEFDPVCSSEEKIKRMNALDRYAKLFENIYYKTHQLNESEEFKIAINDLNNEIFNGQFQEKQKLIDCVLSHVFLSEKLLEIYSQFQPVTGSVKKLIEEYVNKFQMQLFAEASPLESFLSSSVESLLHKNDSGFNHFWEMIENHMETFFLYVTNQLTKEYVNNFSEIKNILHETTLVQDINVEENFNYIMQGLNNANINICEDELESKEIEKHENVKKFNKIFDLLLRDRNDEIFGIPDNLKQFILKEGEKQVLDLSQKLDQYKKTYVLKKSYADEVIPSPPFHEIIQELGNISSFLLKQGGKWLYSKNKRNEVIVLKVIYNGLDQFTEDFKIISIFKKILSAPETVNEFKRICLDPNYLEFFGFKKQIIQNAIEYQFGTPLNSFMGNEQDFKIENETHNILDENLEKIDLIEDSQRIVYRSSIEKLLNLFIQKKSKESESLTGLEALFELFPQVPAPLIQKLWNWMIEEFTEMLPQFLDFSHERMEFILRSLNKELTKPIIFDPSKGRSKKTGNEWKKDHEKFIHSNSTKILSDLLGLKHQSVNEDRGFSEVAIKNTIENSAFGEFASELFTNIANIGLNVSIDFIKNESLMDSKDKKTLEDLQRDVIANGIHYPFRFLGAFVEHATDIFGNTILNDLRVVMLFIGASILKGLGYLFKITHLEDLLVDFIFKMTKKSVNKAIDDFKTSRPDDDILCRLLKIFEEVEGYHFHQKLKEPLAVNIG